MRARLHITVMLSAAATAAAFAPTAGAAARFVPGEALVRYEPGTTPAERAAARDRAGVELEDVLDIPRTQLVSFDGPVSAAVARLERSPDVADAQPNYRYQASASAPDDNFFGEQWGLGAAPGVNVLPAWDRNRGAGQVIAVVDTGVDLTHPDLLANLWENPGEVPANGLDDDANGKVDDVHGYDFVHTDPDPDDFHFHGTHVAGIAAAVAGNHEGVAGVAPEASVMAVRALDGDGFGTTAQISQAIRYAAEEGAGVINLSLGGPAGGGLGDQVYAAAVAAAGAANAVVVAAAGNSSADNDITPTLPCTLPGAHLICVAALDPSGALASYSNEGLNTVDVGAPGSEVLGAKTAWADPLFSENFDNGLEPAWDNPGSSQWTELTPGLGGNGKAATTGSYGPGAAILLTKSSPLPLAGERGCRMHFDLRYDIHPTDVLWAGAVTLDFGVWDMQPFNGTTDGWFDATEVSISDLDGRNDVYPSFELYSDASDQDDGAYLDNLSVVCRDQTYDNSVVDVDDYALPGAGSYMEIGGTSMAAPHVAGVAALVRTAAPELPAAQVVEAIKDGGISSASLIGKTSSGKRVDALGAIDAALALPKTTTTTPPPPSGGQWSTAPVTTRPSRPGPAEFGTRFGVDRRGRLTMRIFADPQLRGRLTLRAGAARAVVARATFRTSRRGRAAVRLRLGRAGRRLLRLGGGRVRARVRVVLTNAAGLRSVTTASAVLRTTRR